MMYPTLVDIPLNGTPDATLLFAAYQTASANAENSLTPQAKAYFAQRAEDHRCRLLVHYPEIAKLHGLAGVP